MIKSTGIIESTSFEPYLNQAVEEALLDSVKSDEVIMYLWQNRKTVVIGKNQNAERECRVARLEEEGGYLARRLSGGGAVFHDFGNLNFTFFAVSENYNLERQTEVILRAVKNLGISANRNGRNDIEIDGRKFSGNAFYKRGDRCMHHGTILVDVDKTEMSRYLRASELKLKSKSVASVRSRVINLAEISPTVNVSDIKTTLLSSFEEVYGINSRIIDFELFSGTKGVLGLRNRFADERWRLDNNQNLYCEFEARFAWGEIQILIRAEKKVIKEAKIYTDSLDEGLSEALEPIFEGCLFRSEAMSDAVARKAEEIVDNDKKLAFLDVAKYFLNENI